MLAVTWVVALLGALPSRGADRPLADGGFVTDFEILLPRGETVAPRAHPGPDVDLRVALEAQPAAKVERTVNGALRMRTRLRSSGGQHELRLGCDGVCELWVDGAMVLRRAAPYGLWLDDREVTVTLNAGPSEVEVRLEARRGRRESLRPRRVALRVLPPAGVAPPVSLMPVAPWLSRGSRSLTIGFEREVPMVGAVSTTELRVRGTVTRVSAVAGDATPPRGPVPLDATLNVAPQVSSGGALGHAVSTGLSTQATSTLELPIGPDGDRVVTLTLTDGKGASESIERPIRVTPALLRGVPPALERLGRDRGRRDVAWASLAFWTDKVLLMHGLDSATGARPPTTPESDSRLVAQGFEQLRLAIEDFDDSSHFEARSGAFVRAYRSPFDGAPQPFAMYVPDAAIRGAGERGPGRRGARDVPFIVALHPSGYTPTRTLKGVLGLESERGASRARLSHLLPSAAEIGRFDAVVAAPWGYDGTGSRYVGKVDVLTVMDLALGHYRIDPHRVLLTGGSLGGLGTWQLGLRMPDRFSGLMPIAGYGSVRLYDNVRGKRLAPWERFLVDRRDNVTFVPNARYLPMRCVHGERDNPKRSEVIVERYRELGYPAAFDVLPGIGHAAWDDAWAQKAALAFVQSTARPDLRAGPPDRVTLVSGSYRHAMAYGLTIDRFADHARLGRLDLERRGGRNPPRGATARDLDDARASPVLVFDPENVARFTAELGDAPTDVRVGGRPFSRLRGRQTFRVDAGGRWTRESSSPPAATSEAPSTLDKRPGLSGPIDDIRYEPHLFVYGSAVPADTETNRRLAEHLSRYGWTDARIALPVLADHELQPDQLRSHHVVLIGTPASNQWLAQIAPRLPVVVDRDSITVGDVIHRGAHLGTTFIAPNPLSPNRYVLVYTGTDRRGVWLAGWLPEWLPDWVVYDDGITTERGGYLMGSRRPLGAGFFDEHWQVARP
ncbi:MAG: hypothetical protein IV100_31090 [Myxococcales bacterium]|nr:hypothetical protein [Myxococcales bacterium]